MAYYECDKCKGSGWRWFKRCDACKGNGIARPPKDQARPIPPPPPPPRKNAEP